jgi:hypothetical protein
MTGREGGERLRERKDEAIYLAVFGMPSDGAIAPCCDTSCARCSRLPRCHSAHLHHDCLLCVLFVIEKKVRGGQTRPPPHLSLSLSPHTHTYTHIRRERAVILVRLLSAWCMRNRKHLPLCFLESHELPMTCAFAGSNYLDDFVLAGLDLVLHQSDQWTHHERNTMQARRTVASS